MARNDGVHRTTVRNVNLTTAKAQNAQHHNERQKESYTNQDIVPERTALNVHYKAPTGDYAEMFRQMEEEKIISTRGLKPDAHHFGELIFDVNSAYFHNHGGYDYAKDFYAEAYKAAVEIVGGEQYILSAVMHADERNSAMSEALGQDVYHYHLHVVYIPVVEKQVLWTKRCKDPSLVGTVKETIMQVSASKKWISRPAVDEDGNPVLRKNGKPVLKKSYSILQDQYFDHMRAAGYTDVERGERGSTEEHLTVTQFKVHQEQARLAQIQESVSEKQNDLDAILSEMENAADRLTATESELDSVKQKRDAVQEQYQTLAGGIKNAERYAAEYIRPADEWLPAPNTLESARSYRIRIMPIVDRFGKILLKLYTQFVNLKSKYSQLLERNKDLTSRVEHLHSKCRDMEQEVSDYRLLRQHVGAEAVDHALEEARKADVLASKNRLKRDSFEH